MSERIIQKIAETLGATEPFNGTWIEAILETYTSERTGAPIIQQIAEQEGATSPINGTWLQAWAFAVGAFEPINANWLEGILENISIEPIVGTLPTSGTFINGSNVGSWVVNEGVTSITVECWGSGGSGARTSLSSNIGSGGGGGWYESGTITVTPGQTIYYNIPGTTPCPTSAGVRGNGSPAWVNKSADAAPSSASDGVQAPGGQGALNNNNSFGPGNSLSNPQGSSVGNGDFYFGGNGANGSSSVGGGGGSSAGSGANGVNATTSSGASAPSEGGNGGNGRTSSSGTGFPGATPGGGGGGALSTTTTNRAGGAGGAGRIRLTYA